MQKVVEPLAKKYCDKVARRLRGWVRDSTITEITLDCTDSICSNPELSDCDLPPAELWRKIVGRFGRPHEYAMRFIEEQGKLQAHTRYWLIARYLTIVTIIVVLFASVFVLYLRAAMWPSEYTITDPTERAAAIASLHETFDRYRSLKSCRMLVVIENHVYGNTLMAEYQLFHRNTNTILRPTGVDVEHVSFTDSLTTIYHPALRAYATFTGTEQAKTLFGHSLLIGLLQNSFQRVQVAVKDNDVVMIRVNDTEVVYKISGVYFAWGDANFSIVLDRRTPTIRRFSVERANITSEDESCLYSEEVIEADFAVEVPERTTVLKMPTDVRYTMNMMPYLYHDEAGWKAMSLLGKPVPSLAGIDVRTNRRVDIAAYRGRPLLLVCCSTWVPWHRLYLAALAEFYPLYRKLGIEVVVLAPDVEPRYTQEFLARTPMPFPYITDYQGWSNPAFSRFELYAKYDYTPTFIAIDAGGKVVGVTSRYYSPIDHSLSDLLQVISPLLTENTKTRLAGQVHERFLRLDDNDDLPPA